ncbi:pentapeptide repeat-containing protein [Nonomuraea sp. MG754425]|uniref:pentapeptide repeat-containing protein n=1 Tax=Nonomuraea sp. MG754425 TaxID=2570319 RepID=UPI001F430BB0|nr:pentapeptide repeat-containing protein [Nonomuraea sp. MG754425]MCF6475759.1 pentapeptide repeat-containing protein [Nonomuraea sp. MG754425]
MSRLPRRAPRQGAPEPSPVHLSHIGIALALTLFAATLMAGGLLAAALAWIGLPSKLTLDTGNLLEIIKISLAVVGGIGGAVALVVAYRKQRLAEEENQRARLTTRRENTKLYAERFDKATDKLGSESPAVRLAGVHALAALADGWTDGRQMCIDVLCAYLRMPPEPEPDIGQEPARHSAWRAMREVRATIIRLIGTHLSRNAPAPWHGHDFDFTGVTFDASANFAGAVFSGGRVWFIDAVFSGEEIFFTGATFSGSVVMFNRAVFSGSTWFHNATFGDSEISFEGAVFSGGKVSFARAIFSGASVIFSGAIFSGSRVSFADAKFSSGRIPFDGAKFSGGDVDFTQVAEWSHPPTGLPNESTVLRLPASPESQPV